MMGVLSLGYLRLSVTDIDAWKVFADDFLGLMPVEGADPDSLYYRMDAYPPRLVVTSGPEAKATAIAFEVTNKRHLANLVDAVEKWGTKVSAGRADECAERRVTGFVRFDDPAGNPLEVFYGPVLDHVPVRAPTVSGFVTGGMGMGHVIVTAEDTQVAFDFYTEVLGFVERNTLGPVWFLGCNARHHTFGIAPGSGPGRLLHVMLEVETLDDVGLALDRADALGIPMMHSLGKHTNDHMVSFYVYSPEEYAIEYGWNGLRVDGEEPTYEITKGAFWGHKLTPPPSASRQ